MVEENASEEAVRGHDNTVIKQWVDGCNSQGAAFSWSSLCIDRWLGQRPYNFKPNVNFSPGPSSQALWFWNGPLINSMTGGAGTQWPFLDLSSCIKFRQ